MIDGIWHEFRKGTPPDLEEFYNNKLDKLISHVVQIHQSEIKALKQKTNSTSVADLVVQTRKDFLKISERLHSEHEQFMAMFD